MARKQRSKSDRLDFDYPPATTKHAAGCYAALCDLGLGTGWAAVVDHRTSKPVRFRLATVTLIHHVACVACESLGFADGVHIARLPDGQIVEVRDVRDTFAAAASLKVYDPDSTETAA